MSKKAANKYEVYQDAEKIRLEEITWEKKETGNPNLKVRVLIDGRSIKNVSFKRDIMSKAYAMPPFKDETESPEITILFGGMVQEILDHFANYLLPPMKPLGLNPLTGEYVLNPEDRIDTRAIESMRQKINGHQFEWKK
jgi:hypothetical protein